MELSRNTNLEDGVPLVPVLADHPFLFASAHVDSFEGSYPERTVVSLEGTTLDERGSVVFDSLLLLVGYKAHEGCYVLGQHFVHHLEQFRLQKVELREVLCSENKRKWIKTTDEIMLLLKYDQTSHA